MILVAGPPCGGKTTYVRQHAAPGESVLDFDDLVEALAGDRYTRSPDVIAAARDEWARRLPGADWLIWCAPRRRDRGRIRGQFTAKVVVVTASESECLRRAAAGRPASWRDAICEWFRMFEPSRSGELVVDTTPRQAMGIFGDV